jgi:hypothetical protein
LEPFQREADLGRLALLKAFGVGNKKRRVVAQNESRP